MNSCFKRGLISIGMTLSEEWVVMVTPPKPSARSCLNRLKWRILKSREERSHVSEIKVKEHLFVFNKC